MVKRVDSKRIDLTGKRYGDLTVIQLSDKRGQNNTLLWECKCSCGKVIYLQGFALIHGHYKSCGCKHKEKRDEGVRKHIERDRVDGTRISALDSKLHKGNRSGYKGVSWSSTRKKWVAYIGFQGKQITLGYFNNKQDAIKARQLAEEKYYKPIKNKNESK